MTYTIKKGRHYSCHRPKLHRGDSMRIKFRFMDGCWFPLDVRDDSAINKLCGWSMGYHHRNSIRCGWTPNNKAGDIDLFFYLYNGGVRIERFFAKVELGLEYELDMALDGDIVSFCLRDFGLSTINSVYFKKPKCRLSYVLFPYVGGRLPARMDTKIAISGL
jgi:hypothetical protein